MPVEGEQSSQSDEAAQHDKPITRWKMLNRGFEPSTLDHEVRGDVISFLFPSRILDFFLGPRLTLSLKRARFFPRAIFASESAV